jgi:hypothetical protein
MIILGIREKKPSNPTFQQATGLMVWTYQNKLFTLFHPVLLLALLSIDDLLASLIP